jgi:hypothetical protein
MFVLFVNSKLLIIGHPSTVGPVVGFWVGFSLGTCCRIWLGPPIHFILIPDSLHTYRKCCKAFNHGWQSYCHNTIPYRTIPLLQKGVGLIVGFWVDFSLGTCCKIWLGPPIPCILIPDPLHTYKRCLTYFTFGGQSYDCHYSTVITIALAKFGGECVDFWHVSYCYVMIGSSHPLNTHTSSTSYIYRALDILYMRWAVIWVCPYSTIITIALAMFGVRW